MAHRIERINSEFKKSISGIIRNKIKDPRVNEMVSVLDVSTAKDLKTAKVRISIFSMNTIGGVNAGSGVSGGSANSSVQFAILDALSGSVGYIRKELAEEYKNLRTIPALSFVLDTSADYSQRINTILDDINKD